MIPGAHSLPIDQLWERVGELEPRRPTVVYCRSGHRSYNAYRILSGLGFEHLFNLSGGMMAWSAWQAAQQAAGEGAAASERKLSDAEPPSATADQTSAADQLHATDRHPLLSELGR